MSEQLKNNTVLIQKQRVEPHLLKATEHGKKQKPLLQLLEILEYRWIIASDDLRKDSIRRCQISLKPCVKILAMLINTTQILIAERV